MSNPFLTPMQLQRPPDPSKRTRNPNQMKRRTHHEKKTRTLFSFSKRPFLRWVFWFSLALYLLFLTFPTCLFHLSGHDQQNTSTIPTKTRFPLLSRVLVESITKTNIIPRLKLTTTASGAANGIDPLSLRIYVYDLPSRYNADWVAANPRCSTHLFASEVAIHHAILNSPVRTTDPSDADFFFVPVYVSCNFSTVNGFPALSVARPLLSSAVTHISTRFPFWNRTAGSDHVFVASHDFGACFHTMEDVAIADGIPSFLKNSILLQTFGVKHPHVCQDVEHVLIPPYVPVHDALLDSSPAKNKRDIFAFFRGKLEVHPKNISGRYYSKKVRTEIWRRYGESGFFYVKRKRYDGFRAEIARSVFCLCPRGWAPWSPRMVEAVVLGCVPVIIADGIRLPFPEAVPWGNISVAVREDEIGELERVLRHVAATNLSEIQQNLWDPAVRRALVFNRRITEGDATWQMLRDLAGKIGRSWKRRVVDDEGLVWLR